MVASNPLGDRRPEMPYNGTAKTIESVARDRAWQRRFKQRARRQLRREYEPRHVFLVLSGMGAIEGDTACITVSGTKPWDISPWQRPRRVYRAAIRKLGVG
jgi:hypothetical protein